MHEFPSQLPSPPLPLDLRLKRLRFRSEHRGSKEMDVFLTAFAARHLALFSPAELDAYETILDAEDSDLWDWLTARADPPRELRGDVLRRMQNFRLKPSN